MSFFRLLPLTVLIYLLPIQAIAEAFDTRSKDIFFRRLSVKDGLPSAYINVVQQHDDGMMWIGTKYGLSRFDGNTFSTFFPDTTYSSESEDITALLLSSKGTFWVGSDAGLMVFNKAANSFQAIPIGDDLATILALFEDDSGHIWVGTDNGLLQLSSEGSVVERFLPGTDVKMILQHAGKLWVGTKQGLFVRNSRAFRKVALQANSNFDVRYESIYSGVVYRNALWLATDRDGLLSVDMQNEQLLKQLTTDQGILHSNRVFAISKHKENLWLSYFHAGLGSFNPRSNEYKHYQHQPGQPYSLPLNNVNQVYFSADNLLWVPTTNGLAVTNLEHMAVNYLGAFQHITNKHVWSVTVKQQELWFGTENGLNIYDIANKKMYTFTQDEDGNGLPRTLIWKIFHYADRTYLATNRGLLLFDRANGTASPVQNALFAVNNQTGGAVYTLVQQGRFLLTGGLEGDIGVIDLPSGEYVNYFAKVTPGMVTDIQPYQDGYLLATGQGLGFVSLPLESDQKQQVRAEMLTKERVNAMTVVGNRVWQAAAKEGISVFVRHQQQWRQEEDIHIPLPGINRRIRAIHKINDRILWITGNSNLVRYDTTSQKTEVFDSYLHWMDMEFHEGATNQSRGNIVAFGGNQGLVFFDADAMQLTERFPRLGLRDAQVMDRKVPVSEQEFYIQPSETYYAFRFSAQEFISPQRIDYQYRLLPSSDSWRPMKNGQISFSRLGADDYQLQVRSTDINGRWNEDYISVDLKVIPPFWQTIYARVVFAGAVLTMLVLIALVQKHKLKRLAHIAEHDPLTGLPNRRSFMTQLEQLIDNTEKKSTGFTLVFFDLNGFKQINDTFGHEVGDLLLSHVSTHVSKVIRDTDFMARLGGDEFVLLLPGVVNKTVIQETLQRIHDAIGTRFLFHSDVIQCSGSIGVAICDESNRVGASSLLRQADTAMYEAKSKQQPFVFFSKNVA